MKKLSRRFAFLALSTVVVGSYLALLVPGVWAKGDTKAAASLYEAKCAMCHAKNGSGSTPMGKSMKVPDLRSKEVQEKSDAQLALVIAKGEKMMPQYGSQFSKKQINDLVGYIRTLGKK